MNLKAIFDAMAEGGPITASRIVAEASDPEHPLHSRFEWDDTEAAHQFRLMQARKLIVTIRYTPTGATRAVQAYIHVPEDFGEGKYVGAAILARHPDQWQRARDQVLAYLAAAQEGIDDLDEILRVLGQPSRRTTRASRSIRQARQEVVAIA